MTRAPSPPPLPPGRDNRAESYELEAALGAVARAGEAVMGVYRRSKDSLPQAAMKKEDGSPVTEADLASHRILARELARTGHPVRSEEGDAVRTESDAIWVVDPLDGTSDFVDRTGEFTIMAALVREGIPALGVILWPTEGITFAAQKGRGSFRHSEEGGWQKIRVTNTSVLPQCRAVGSRHHLTDRERDFVAGLGITSFQSIGSSLKVCMISSGEAEAYVTTTDRMKQWDTAASHCIITEAGGRMTDLFGRDLEYNDDEIRHLDGILATNGAIHGRIVGEFGSCIADAPRPASEQSAPAEK